MVILWIDPWLETTWFWILKFDWSGFDILDFGIIQTSSKDDFVNRLAQVKQDIISLIKQYKPDLAALEKLFFGTNIKTAIAVSHSRWVMIAEIASRWIPIVEFSPNEVKSMICGSGKAPKQQIQFMVASHLKLEESPRPDDAADALAIAICWAYSNYNLN